MLVTAFLDLAYFSLITSCNVVKDWDSFQLFAGEIATHMSFIPVFTIYTRDRSANWNTPNSKFFADFELDDEQRF